MATDKDRISDFNSAYKQAISIWGPWLKEAKRDLQFYLGDQYEAQDKEYLKKERRTVLVFNRLRRVVKALEGFQRKNRLALKVSPVEGGDEQTASQLSAVVQWVMQYENAYNVMSEAFSGGPLKTGINLINIYVDFREDLINGDIRFKRWPYNRFLLDPNFSDRTLKDCGYMLGREWLTKDAVKTLLPGRSKDIDDLHIKGRDEKYTFAPQRKDLWGKDLMRYDEFRLRTTRPVKMLLDPRTGAQKEWPADNRRLELFLSQFPYIKVLDRQKETMELNIIVEDQLFYTGPDPTGLDDFPFVAEIGFYDPEYEHMSLKLQGLVRCMRDPQTESNKRRSKMLDIIDGQLSSGWEMEEGALVDKTQAFQTGQAKVLWYKENKLTEGRGRRIMPPDISQGLFRLTEIFDKDIDEIAGMNAELFGTPEDIQTAGILAKLRIGQGLTILQDLFDNHRLSKKSLGQKIIKIAQNNFTLQKIKRIINEEPTPGIRNMEFSKYDAVPEEGILTDTQRHMYFVQLVNLKQMGAPIPWIAIIDAAPIEQKSKLKEMIAAEEKRQAQAAQVEVMDRQLTQGMMRSKIGADIAKAEENRAQAIENMANATLDRIKTLREIGRLDDEHVMALVDWVRRLEAGEQVAPAARGRNNVRRLTRR